MASIPAAGAADFGAGLAAATGRASAGCLVLGNFDGVHIGHRAILGAAREWADRLGLPLTAVTFEPHPRTIIDPELPFSLLTPLELRRRLLAESGVDRIWVIPFDERLLRMTPEAFMGLLRGRVEIRAMVAGTRFSIGKGSVGRLDFLQRYAAREGIQVQVIRALDWEGEAVSSSAIRARLRAGAIDAVQSMLGRPFQVLGEVIHGEGLGRRLGFPTANLRLAARQALPPDGVYAMRLTTESGLTYPAVGSIGDRPHFGGGERQFEVHCLTEPAEPLYGQAVLVSVLRQTRPQQRFASDQALVEQMGRDAAQARSYLAGA